MWHGVVCDNIQDVKQRLSICDSNCDTTVCLTTCMGLGKHWGKVRENKRGNIAMHKCDRRILYPAGWGHICASLIFICLRPRRSHELPHGKNPIWHCSMHINDLQFDVNIMCINDAWYRTVYDNEIILIYVTLQMQERSQIYLSLCYNTELNRLNVGIYTGKNFSISDQESHTSPG